MSASESLESRVEAGEQSPKSDRATSDQRARLRVGPSFFLTRTRLVSEFSRSVDPARWLRISNRSLSPVPRRVREDRAGTTRYRCGESVNRALASYGREISSKANSYLAPKFRSRSRRAHRRGGLERTRGTELRRRVRTGSCRGVSTFRRSQMLAVSTSRSPSGSLFSVCPRFSRSLRRPFARVG